MDNIDWVSSLIGGLIGFIASIGALTIEKLWDRFGHLQIFYLIKSGGRSPIDNFGTSNSADGPTFVVPLIFELQNTSNTTRVMRDVAVLMYKDGTYVHEMTQIGQSGSTGDKKKEYGSDNQSYSFVVQPRSINKIYGTYVFLLGSNPKEKYDFNEIRLRYYDERNKAHIHHIRYIDNPWEQSYIDGDDDWVLLNNNTRVRKKEFTNEPIMDKMPLSAEKTAYLQAIQEPISRMSTASAIFKGFAATIVAGIAALTYCDVNTYILGLSFVPVVLFLLLDIYYLKLEKKYRYLYEQVRIDMHPVDFSMKLYKDNRAAKSRIIDCLISPSIWLFYPTMIAILIVVFVLKFKGVI